ncbi:MAG: ribosome biogenesis GTPase Der, partial [Alphaproteobacteria bacterium]
MRLDAPVVVVAIAGRPNAGKSTLFNRLFGRRLAIVDDTPGVTRDANRAVLEHGGRRWEMVDTGGIEETALGSGLAERVQAKSLETLRSADAIVHLVDGQAGLSAADRAVAVRIRELGVPTLLVVNKIDRPEHAIRALEFTALGEGEPVVLSSAHGLGMDDFWEAVEGVVERAGRLPAVVEDEEDEDLESESEEEVEADGEPDDGGDDEHGADDDDFVDEGEEGDDEDDGEEESPDPRDDRPPRIALVGRPNVGKSSLLNRLAGFERARVDSVPGTTRDPIDQEIRRRGRTYVVVDTAGLRRPSRIHETIEGYAASASVRSIERAEVAVLVLDATVGVTDQDLRVADLAWRRGRGFVVAVNKVDLAPTLAAEQCHETILRRLPQWPPVPLVRLSALAGTGLGTLFAAIDTVVAAYRRRFPTPRLNDLLHRAVEAHSPPLVGGRSAKLMYATQVRRGPHEIALFVNRPDGFPEEYLRFLRHRIREEFGLVGVPVKLDVRARPRPTRERPPGAEAERAGAARSAPRRRRPRKGSAAPAPRRPQPRASRPGRSGGTEAAPRWEVGAATSPRTAAARGTAAGRGPGRGSVPGAKLVAARPPRGSSGAGSTPGRKAPRGVPLGSASGMRGKPASAGRGRPAGPGAAMRGKPGGPSRGKPGGPSRGKPGGPSRGKT